MISQMVQVGRLQVATPATMAMAIRNPTEAQVEVDARVQGPARQAAIDTLSNNPAVVTQAATQAASLAASDAGLVRKGTVEALRPAAIPGVSWYIGTQNPDGSLSLGAFVLNESGDVHSESAVRISTALGFDKNAQAAAVRKGDPEALRSFPIPGVSWFAAATVNAQGKIELGALALDETGNLTAESASKISSAIGYAATRIPVPTGLTVIGDSMSAPGKIPQVISTHGEVLAARFGLEGRYPAVPGENPMDAMFRSGLPIKITGMSQIPQGTAEFVLEANQVNDGAAGHRNTTATDGSGLTLGNSIGWYTLEVLGIPMQFRRVVNTEGGYTLGQWRVNRITAGTRAVPIPPGQPVYGIDLGAARFKNGVFLLAAGRNDLDAGRIISTYRRIIDWIGHDLWFVIAPVLVSGSEVTSLRASLFPALRAEFGEKFIDWQPTMASYASLTKAGLTPTAQDDADIAAGVVPFGLRYDTTHFNDLGQQIWGGINTDLITPLLAARGIHAPA